MRPMELQKIQRTWNRERLGLLMITASLVVIALTVGMLFVNQQQAEENHIRKQGVSLVRLLSRMPFDEVIPQNGRQGVLSVLEHISDRSAFAYLAIVDADNRPLSEISAQGVPAPSAPLPVKPALWHGERMLTQADGREISEFHAPLLDDGRLAGHIRLGYLRPRIGLSMDQLPFLATLALPIFLLTPLFYFLVRREVRPLARVNSQLDQLVEQGNLNRIEITATGELQEFMGYPFLLRTVSRPPSLTF